VVAHRVSCLPVFARPGSAMIVLKHVLLPVDFSDNSLRATEYAVLFCRKYAATLHLVHVIEDPTVYLPVLEGYSLPSHAQLETYAQDRLENWLSPDQSEGLTLEHQWMHGNPAARIVEYARDCRLDMIVMGAHGRGGATHLLMGNTAEKVVRKAPCPVLTVNPETF
jgi:nucleotide-binding universal stress UspA family protein